MKQKFHFNIIIISFFFFPYLLAQTETRADESTYFSSTGYLTLEEITNTKYDSSISSFYSTDSTSINIPTNEFTALSTVSEQITTDETQASNEHTTVNDFSTISNSSTNELTDLSTIEEKSTYESSISLNITPPAQTNVGTDSTSNENELSTLVTSITIQNINYSITPQTKISTDIVSTATSTTPSLILSSLASNTPTTILSMTNTTSQTSTVLIVTIENSTQETELEETVSKKFFMIIVISLGSVTVIAIFSLVLLICKYFHLRNKYVHPY